MEKNFVNLHKELSKYLNEDEITQVKKAYIFAVSAHEGQMRKSGEPYIIHPISVACVLAEQKLPVTVIVAGLLHDVVEDTDISMEELAVEFTNEVAEIVDGVTKLGNIPGLSTDQVKAANHRKIILATAKDIRVILVKLADRVHNMSTIKYMNEAKQKIIASETLEVYTPIAHRLGMYRIKWELEDLSFKVLNKEAYDDIASKLNMKRSQREDFVREMISDTQMIIDNNNIDAVIKGRSKHIYSIYKKMKSKNHDFEELTDLFAFRIIVNTIPECYSVLGLIHENFKPIPMRFKDYIPTPKHNLYQSIHTTVINQAGFPVEFQIRTKEMDLTAEYGVASHWMYKSDSENDAVQKEVEYRLEWLQKALDSDGFDDSLDFMNQVKNDLLSESLIVYTPTGDVIELPVGSTVLDFAYYIHSKVGNEAVSAKVNGKVVSLFYKVKIGDVVQVITSDVSEPSISYIQKVKTTRAKESLKKYFKNTEKQNIRNEGARMLSKYSISLGIDNINELLTEEKIGFILSEFGSQTRDEFLYEIGVGEIKIDDIVSFIKKSKTQKVINDSSVFINEENSKYQLRMCRYCSPILGDEIVAIKNTSNISNNEYIIHRSECSHTNETKKSAIWNFDANKIKYICRINMEIKDEKNSVLQVFKAVSDCELNITSIYFRASIGKFAGGKISFELNSIEDYNLLAGKLSDLNCVSSFSRTIEGK